MIKNVFLIFAFVMIVLYGALFIVLYRHSYMRVQIQSRVAKERIAEYNKDSTKFKNW